MKSNSNENACKEECKRHDDCIEAYLLAGKCNLFGNVVTKRGAVQGALYYTRDRGQEFTDCVGQVLYDDMCRVKDAGVTKCSQWVGDKTCDNGLSLSDTFHQVFLNCHRHNYDGGDCKGEGKG